MLLFLERAVRALRQPPFVAVDRKLAIIRDTYAALYEKASGRRAELVEVSIIVLTPWKSLLPYGDINA